MGSKGESAGGGQLGSEQSDGAAEITLYYMWYLHPTMEVCRFWFITSPGQTQITKLSTTVAQS